MRNVTIARLRNIGFEAYGYLHHLLSRNASGDDFAEVTLFAQGAAVEDHFDVDCGKPGQWLKVAQTHGYAGLGSQYRLSTRLQDSPSL